MYSLVNSHWNNTEVPETIRTAWISTDTFPSLSWFWKAFKSRILSSTSKRFVDSPASSQTKFVFWSPLHFYPFLSLKIQHIKSVRLNFSWMLSLHTMLHPYMNKPLNFKMRKEHDLPSSSSRVTEGSTYSHQCFPSVDTGISQLDHLQAKWMHTQAITVGLYWRQNVVRWRLLHTFRNEEPKEIKHVKQKTQTNQPLTYRMRYLVSQQQLNILLNKLIRYLTALRKQRAGHLSGRKLICSCYQKPDSVW